MTTPSHQSDDIIRAARQSLSVQRAGGRRLAPQGARRLKRGHFSRKLRNIAFAVVGIWLALTIIGTIISGIGFTGLAIGAAATVAAVWLFGKYPQMTMPGLADLNPAQADVRTMVGRTELWLESQRRALPPPAVKLVDTIGLQLDVLGDQLAHVDQNHPKAQEVRKLVGEHLPGLVDGYQKIPEHLRYEDSAGGSPNARFMDGLSTISGEIDSLTRQLAAGAIDNLAISTRYLDYKYGAGLDQSEQVR
jgi:hypothetical protein